ncbi:MAG: GIY-YIG nuclease family protein [Terriglobia bacterium]|jgi:hypothetical protein
MPIAPLHFIKQCIEWRDFEKEARKVPSKTRGIYVLFKRKGKSKEYRVQYIGMAGGPKTGVQGRLREHLKTKKATHFSVFEVHDNIPEEEVRELEGILRHIFRKDSRVNPLAGQKSYGKLKKVTKESWREWTR